MLGTMNKLGCQRRGCERESGGSQRAKKPAITKQLPAAPSVTEYAAIDLIAPIGAASAMKNRRHAITAGKSFHISLAISALLNSKPLIGVAFMSRILCLPLGRLRLSPSRQIAPLGNARPSGLVFVLSLLVALLAGASGCSRSAEGRFASRGSGIPSNEEMMDPNAQPATPPAAQIATAIKNSGAAPKPAGNAAAAKTGAGGIIQTAAGVVQAAADAIAPENPWDVPLILPSDLSTWTPEHLRGARIAEDTRLGEALLIFAKQHRGEPEAAETVASMLQDWDTLNQTGYGEKVPIPPPPPVEPGEVAIPRTRTLRRQEQYVPSLIEALAIIGTDRAIQTFRKLISGYAKCDTEDAVTVQFVLASLTRAGGEEYESILLECFTQPENFRQNQDDFVEFGVEGAKIFSSEILQNKVISALYNTRSANLRALLAQKMSTTQLTAAQRQSLLTMLLEGRIENLQAMSTLLVSAELTKSEYETTLHRLSQGSSASMQVILDLPSSERALLKYGRDFDAGYAGDDDQRAKEGQKLTPKEKAKRTVAGLWREELIQGLERKFNAITELDETEDLAKILYTMPTNRTRNAALRFWERFHPEGRKVLGKPEYLLDPGLLPLVKTLEHNNYNFVLARMEPRPLSPPPFKTEQTSGRQEPPQIRQQKLLLDWTYGIESVMRGWMRRGSSAATAQAESGAAANNDVKDWEIALPKGRDKVLEYAIFLGPHLGSQLISPTRLRYRRFEIQASPDELHIFFAKNLKGAISRPVEEGRWLDLSEVREGSGVIRSVDIILRSKTFDQPGPRRTKERIVFDVLQVEIEDPRSTSTES